MTPLYDGKWLPPLAGTPVLVKRLTECLKTRGNYDVKLLSGDVPQKTFRETVTNFFDTPGEVLFYFYGHGCLGPGDLGYFAPTDAAPYAEGLLMHEVNVLAQKSPASEVVLICDCCHAGAFAPASTGTFELLGAELVASAGRVLLAACAAHQSGWETKNAEHLKLGAFSAHVLDGLEGAALPRNSTKIRGSTLGEYVTRQFQEWNQDPISYTREAGTRHCVITSGFPIATETSEKKSARLFGAPFKPSQLFVGRSAELDGLIDTLVAGDRPVAVSATVEGLGGIGKTELVLQLLHHPAILAAYDAIVWLDGAGPLAPQWEKLATEAGISLPKKRPDNFLKPLEKGLKKLGHVLVVLDNATEWASAAEWVPLESPLLVTTRTRDFGGNRFVHTELSVLSDEAATSFLTEMIPEMQDDTGLPKLIEILGGHALALELAGWNMKYVGLSPGEYIERLKKHTEDSEFALSAIRYGNTLDGCLELTWNSLRHDASRTLWRRASLFAPTSAHRDLLRVSAAGVEEYRDDMNRRLQYMDEDDGELDHHPEFRQVRAMADAMVSEPSEFDKAYAELRAFHVLARVEGYNGERWAMHRIVREFGRARLRKWETTFHGMALAEWLRHPTIPLRPEVPHFVATILDSARQQDHEGVLMSRRNLHRSPDLFDSFDSGYFLEFIREELNDPKALILILEGLSDENEDVRVQSIRLLEHLGPVPEVLNALQSSLDDPDASVRRRAGATLAKHGGKQTIEILSEATRGPNLRARLTAVQALGLMGNKAHKTLNEALNCDDERVQAEAALLLCEQGQKSGVPILVEKLQTVLGRQKDRLIEALGESRDLRAIESLADLLPGNTHRVRAIIALGTTGGDQAYELIVNFLYDANDNVKCAAAEAVDAIDSKKGIERIVDALASSEFDHRSRFPRLVQNIAKKRKAKLPTDLQVKLLRVPDWNVRLESAIQLGKAKSQEAAEALIEALGDNDNDVRREVAKALGRIGDARAVDRLKDIGEKDSDEKVKKAAKAAVKRIGGKE